MPPAVRLASAALTLVFGALVLGLLIAGPVAAADPPRRDRGPQTSTGLPLPRFVTLRSGEVNLRTGPNTTYPVEWVFMRKGMPVEITQEWDTWRRIRDWQGSEGWVHQSMLSGKRAVVVTGDTRTIYKQPDAASPAVARAQPGVMGSLLKCQSTWCQVDLGGHKGWLARGEVWGVYANEAVE